MAYECNYALLTYFYKIMLKILLKKNSIFLFLRFANMYINDIIKFQMDNIVKKLKGLLTMVHSEPIICIAKQR